MPTKIYDTFDSDLVKHPGPYHGSDSSLLASLNGGPGSFPGQSMLNLWFTKWHWDMFT
jgi:hypothetical protein